MGAGRGRGIEEGGWMARGDRGRDIERDSQQTLEYLDLIPNEIKERKIDKRGNSLWERGGSGGGMERGLWGRDEKVDEKWC